jgi:hypothetical protein
MIRLLAHPLPNQQLVSLSQYSRVASEAYCRTGEGGGGVKSYDRKNAWALYKSFNTLWPRLSQ